MKESRFIELLNLYVDQQLSSAEAAELDAEIERNATRRQLYQQYCRIQKGCTLLFEKERTQAPVNPRLAAALAEADRKISGESRKKIISWPTYLSVGSLAAAACFAAVLMINRTPSGEPARGNGSLAARPKVSQPATAVSTSPSQPVSVAQNDNSPAPAQSRPEFHSVLATRSNGEVAASFSPALSESGEIKSWMENVELMPVANLAEQRLTLQASQTAAPESGVLRSRKPVTAEAAEMTAFQFQR